MAAALFSCEERSATSRHVAALQAEERRDDELSDRFDPIRSCLNSMPGQLIPDGREYVTRVNPETGPTGKERALPTPSVPRGWQECVAGLKKATASAPPDEELDARVSAFAAALTTLAETLTEAAPYYDEKDYLDDDFAKAKRLHPQLVSGYEAFATAYQSLASAFEERNDDLEKRSMLRMERENGRVLPFQVQNVNHHAKTIAELMRVVDSEQAQPGDWKRVDESALGVALQAYETAMEEAEQYVAEHKEEADSVPALDNFFRTAKELRKATKALQRRIRDAREYREIEMVAGLPPDGSPAKTREAYAVLVRAGNLLRWSSYEYPED